MLLSTVETLMADPLGWIHPSRTGTPAHWNSAAPRGIINKIIVQQFSLPAPATISDDCRLTHTVIEHWGVLGEAAWYMACQRYREQLLHSEYQHQLSAKAQRFMQFDIVAPRHGDIISLDEQTLWQLAYGEVAPLLSSLQPGIAVCIRLLFPRQVDEQPMAPADHPFDSVLFYMALQHARKYSAPF